MEKTSDHTRSPILLATNKIAAESSFRSYSERNLKSVFQRLRMSTSVSSEDTVPRTAHVADHLRKDLSTALCKLKIIPFYGR